MTSVATRGEPTTRALRPPRSRLTRPMATTGHWMPLKQSGDACDASDQVQKTSCQHSHTHHARSRWARGSGAVADRPLDEVSTTYPHGRPPRLPRRPWRPRASPPHCLAMGHSLLCRVLRPTMHECRRRCSSSFSKTLWPSLGQVCCARCCCARRSGTCWSLTQLLVCAASVLPARSHCLLFAEL